MSFERISNSQPAKILLAALCFVAVALTGTVSDVAAQAPAQEKKFTDSDKSKALTYKPKQDGVDYDYNVGGRPSKDIVEKTKMQNSEELFGIKTGYVLADATNRVVRALLDTNKDRKLDRFSYFKDGIEVYREIDTDYDSEPNEYRWMGAAGTRWGIDRNQDGEIDQWKVISAEEVAFEVFMSIRNRDDARYQRLLLTNDEFRSLGLKGNIAKDAAARLERARKEFPNMVRGQKAIDGKSKWINSGSGQPGIAAANSERTKDLLCHDHASSVFGSANGTDTLALGTLVKVGDAWRLMELPQVVPKGKPIENGGVLFPVVQVIDRGDEDEDEIPKINPLLAKLYDQLTEQEAAISKEGRAGVQMANLQKDRAMLQWKIYNKIPENERKNWVENIGDTVTYAYQIGYYPDGPKFLEQVIKTLRENKKTDSLDYVRWRMIHSSYYKQLEERDNRGDEKAAEEYYKKLEKFASEYPKSKFAPEALFSIGQYFEVGRNSDIVKAVRWYQACAQRYGTTVYGKRAAGAMARLNGRGKPVRFAGKTVDGKVLDILNRTLRGRIVVAYFWTTRIADNKVNQKNETAFDVFQDVKSKFKDEVIIVSANIEPTATAEKYKDFDGDMTGIFEMHSPGGMESSPLAIQMGIVSEPTMIVWDEKGNVFDAESTPADLERVIQRIKKKVANNGGAAPAPAARAAKKNP